MEVSAAAVAAARGHDLKLMKLQLERIELREIELPLKSPFETSYGECVAAENPFYNHETIDTAWLITSKYVAPLLAAARVTRAAEVSRATELIRENRMAKGGVEAAVWDLEARLYEKPLWQHIGGTRDEIACGVSIGIQASPEALVETVGRELGSGYQRIKLKIKPGMDVQLVEAVRRRFPAITLSVDANSA